MPRPKVRTRATETAEQVAIDAYQAVLAHDEHRKQVAALRASAIRAALDAGSTYDRLADLMGVTRGRVQQMAKPPADT